MILILQEVVDLVIKTEYFDDYISAGFWSGVLSKLEKWILTELHLDFCAES